MSVLDRYNMSGKVALLSGAGRGIGAASALALAEAGADIAVMARSVDQLENVAAQARAPAERKPRHGEFPSVHKKQLR